MLLPVVAYNTFCLNQLLFFNQVVNIFMVRMALIVSSVRMVLYSKRALEDEDQQLRNFISLVIT